MLKTTVALLLALALVVMPSMVIAESWQLTETWSMAAAESWQEVETWGTALKNRAWENVETWITYGESTTTIGRPILVFPDNDTTISDNTPTFQWIAGDFATSHRFLFDNDDTFSSPIENILLGGTATTYAITVPLSDDNYWWKVIAILRGIENSSYTYNFELISPIAPGWLHVESWGDTMKTKAWENVEIWTTTLSIISLGDYPAKGVDYLHTGVADVVVDPPFEFLWKADILGTYDEFSGPIAVGGMVYIANKWADNIFRCLTLKSGTEVWSYELNAGVDGAPLWFDNKVYVATGITSGGESRPGSGAIASLYAFDADNGDLLWKYDGYNSSYWTSTPWVNFDNGIIYWVDGRDLNALDADNGDLIWSDELGAGNHPFVGVYYDGICYSPGKSGSYAVTAYDAETGDPVVAGAEDWWDADWDYRMAYSLNPHPENYQYKLFLDMTDNLNDYARSDFQDLRVVSAENELLPIWRENWNDADNVKLWFRKAENTNDYVWLYFGNAGASNADNGENVFVFFDTFDGSSLNLGKWSVGAGTPVVEGSTLILDNDGTFEGIYADIDYGVDYAWVWRGKYYEYSSGAWKGLGTQSNPGDGAEAAAWVLGATILFRTKEANVAESTSDIPYDQGTWAIMEISRKSSENVLFYINDVLHADHSVKVSTADLEIYHYTGQNADENLTLDWSLVRSYIYPEPTGTLGSIESAAVEWPDINYTIWDSGITVDESDPENVVLYIGASRGMRVLCVDADDGTIYWNRLIDDGGVPANAYMLTVPVVWENQLYVGGKKYQGYNAWFYCLNKFNGETIWSVGAGQTTTHMTYTTPVILPVSGKIVMYAKGTGDVQVRDADNGALLWSYNIGSSFSGQIAVVNSYILISGDSGHLWVFGAPIGLEWIDVEEWESFMDVTEPPPPPPEPPSDEIIWAVFVMRFLSVFGPLGFVAWKFTQIRDPMTGLRGAIWAGVGFVAIVLLWFATDAVEAILTAI